MLWHSVHVLSTQIQDVSIDQVSKQQFESSRPSKYTKKTKMINLPLKLLSESGFLRF